MWHTSAFQDNNFGPFARHEPHHLYKIVVPHTLPAKYAMLYNYRTDIQRHWRTPYPFRHSTIQQSPYQMHPVSAPTTMSAEQPDKDRCSVQLQAQNSPNSYNGPDNRSHGFVHMRLAVSVCRLPRS